MKTAAAITITSLVSNTECQCVDARKIEGNLSFEKNTFCNLRIIDVRLVKKPNELANTRNLVLLHVRSCRDRDPSSFRCRSVP